LTLIAPAAEYTIAELKVLISRISVLKLRTDQGVINRDGDCREPEIDWVTEMTQD